MKSRSGLLPGGELKVKTTICDEIRQSHEAVVIDNVAEDAVYCGHRTAAIYGLQSYISMPIIRQDGTFFGTLCAIDPRPAKLSKPETVGMFKLFAELIATRLDAIDRLAVSEATLLNERQTSELREQFIAVLVHDLRNPLTSIAAGARMLPKAGSKQATAEILGVIQKSVARMSALIDDVLDFARGRLGSGVAKDRVPLSLQPTLIQVISELQSSHPDRAINAEFALTEPVNCDGGRIAQLFSNLLGNALTHGRRQSPMCGRQRKIRYLSSAWPMPATPSRPRGWQSCSSRFIAGWFAGRCRAWPGFVHRIRDRAGAWRNADGGHLRQPGSPSECRCDSALSAIEIATERCLDT
jgi:K+-sensing histidine kinase KdpD